MGVRYKSQCVESTLLHDLIAADCPIITSDGAHLIKCVPSSTEITIFYTEVATNTTTSTVYQPQQILCDGVTITDAVELAWLIVLVWVVAWTIKAISETLRTKS